MNDLLPMVMEHDGVPVTTSRAVAEQFNKQHKHVLRDIQQIIEQLNETEEGQKFSQSNFGPANYMDEQGKPRPAYLLTRDGFTLLAMGFTGAKALSFKLAYLSAFNRMEQLLKGGGLSSGALQDVERRLMALESAAGQGQEAAWDEVSARFFRVLRDALDSGAYYLKDKWDRSPQLDRGELLGVEDGSRTFIKADVAYKLYREGTGSAPLSSRQGLWAVLERTGAIYPRATTKGGRRIACDRKIVTVVCIDGDKLRRNNEI